MSTKKTSMSLRKLGIWESKKYDHHGDPTNYQLQVPSILDAESRNFTPIPTENLRTVRAAVKKVIAEEKRQGKLEFSELTIPVEITESLKRFRNDYPHPSTTAFIMMKFSDSPVHQQITQNIQQTLSSFGVQGVRADHKSYHTDLNPNIQTYMHGCGLGIAVFERVEGEEFNPNVAFEVGYMLALGNPVCLLKERTLKSLQTDLIGKIWWEFDIQRISKTLPQSLSKWIKDQGLVANKKSDSGIRNP